MADFAQRFKMLRQERNLTQKDLSSQLDIPRGTIASWETSDSRLPELNKMETIAQYFSVTVDFLLGRTDIRNTTISINQAEKIYEMINSDCELAECFERLGSSAELKLLFLKIKDFHSEQILKLIKIAEVIKDS